MEKQEKIRLLLAMQEHPENYTDEQLRKLLADDPELADMIRHLTLVKQALAKQDAEEESISVDEEWAAFATEHGDELDALDKEKDYDKQSCQPRLLTNWKERLPFRIAASIIGFLFIAGVAFAAIHIVRSFSRQEPIKDAQEKVEPEPTTTINNNVSSVIVDTLKTDTVPTTESITFDNISLDRMISEIAAYYKVDVEFLNDEVRQLRFFFEWRHEETIEHVLNRLNQFESVTIELNDNRITVE